MPHGMTPPIPVVEITDNGNALRVRCPHREAYAINAINTVHRSAKAFGEIPMCAFGKEMQVDVAEYGGEGIRVLGLLHSSWPVKLQTIWPLTLPDEDSGIAYRKKRHDVLAVCHLHANGVRLEGAHRAVVRSKKRKRIRVTPIRDQQRFSDVL